MYPSASWIWFMVNLWVVVYAQKHDESLCAENSTCIALRHCRPKEHVIYYPCHSGLNLYCCPKEDVADPEQIKVVSTRSGYFPVQCGVISPSDKITGGQDANFGQFPWMALLGYKQKSAPITEFMCGGTLITDRYVLTAAHCIVVSPSHTLVTVRLGEHNLKTERDCYTLKKKTVCTDPHVDEIVKKSTIHPHYDSKTLKNDIALIEAKKPVKFTSYVQPICLPFERSLESKSLVGHRFIISGWGKTDGKKLGGSSILQYASVSVWDNHKCNQALPLKIKEISDTQICANGIKMDACKGDSGGPMVNTTLDIDNSLRTFQIGIVSFATTITCGIEDLPPIYTRVDRYLDWIVDTITLKKNHDSGRIHFENK